MSADVTHTIGGRGSLYPLLPALAQFGLRGWIVTLAVATATLVLISVPTAIIQNPFFTRMTPVRDQDYAIWITTAALAGLIGGTYAVSLAGNQKAIASGGLLSVFAVGCPICNKLVVLLIGTSGALTFFAPLQLFLGLAAIVLLAWTLWLRLTSLSGACMVQLREPAKQ